MHTVLVTGVSIGSIHEEIDGDIAIKVVPIAGRQFEVHEAVT